MATTETPAVRGRVRRPTIQFGPYTFDPDNQLLRRGEEPLGAPPRVLGVLDLLLERAGELVPRQDLIERVWKDAFVTDTSLAEAVSVLRQTLGDDPQSPTYIQTVHRRGYRFVAPVERRERPAPVPPAATALAPESDADVVSPSIGGTLLPWSAAILFGLVAMVAVYQLTRGQDAGPLPVRFPIDLGAEGRFDAAASPFTLSADGRTAVWSACAPGGCRLYLRSLDSLQATAITGTEGGSLPFFSPDGRTVAFFADGKLKKVASTGGSASAIADVAQPRGGVWTPDGRIIVGSGIASGLWQVAAEGGTLAPLTVPHQEDGEVRHAWPSLSPDGRTIFFDVETTLEDDAPARLASASLTGGGRIGAWSTLLAGSSIGRPLANDLLVLARGGELQVAAYDPLRQVIAGVPQTLASGLASPGTPVQFAASPAGSIIYAAPGSGTTSRTLRWLTVNGASAPAPDLPLAGAPSLSPDGRRITWAGAGDSTRADIWVADLDRGAVARLTHDGLNASPVWSGDGRRLVFAQRTSSTFALASIEADGGTAKPQPPGRHHVFPQSMSADGAVLAYVEINPESRSDIWISRGAGVPPAAAVASPFDDVAAAVSGSGKLLAYQSDESGRWDVYVQRLSDGRRAIVSTAGGEHPVWTGDGTALLYTTGHTIMRATVDASSLTVGSPAKVMDLGDQHLVGVAPDGRMLVMSDARPPARSAVLAINWEREARRLLGPPAAALPR